MDRLRREGLTHLEKILIKTEEILVLAKVLPTPYEKDIHREIKEVFQFRTKVELLISSVSSLYKTIIEIEVAQQEYNLWKTSRHPSPFYLQEQDAKKSLSEYLESIDSDLESA